MVYARLNGVAHHATIEDHLSVDGIARHFLAPVRDIERHRNRLGSRDGAKGKRGNAEYQSYTGFHSSVLSAFVDDLLSVAGRLTRK
jgi:hypothetical protein